MIDISPYFYFSEILITMCGISLPNDLKTQTISVPIKPNISTVNISSSPNSQDINDTTVYGIAVRASGNNRLDKDGKPLIGDDVFYGSHIIIKGKQSCDDFKLPLELLQTCCDRIMYEFPNGVEIHLTDSKIMFLGDVAKLVDGEVYELILWYK